MSRIDRIATSATRLLPFALFLLCLLTSLQPLSAQAGAIGGSTAVGSSAPPAAITVTLPLGGAVSTVNLFGQGSPNVDFVNAGDTCANRTFAAGQSCTVNVVFTPSSPGTRPGAIVLLDVSNNVLATQLLTATATGSVGVFVPGIINTAAGDVSWVYDGDGRAATNSAIFLPFGIAVNAKGDLFIADSSNNRIRKVLASTGLISTIAGDGNTGSSGDNGPASAATLNNPSSLALDPAGDLYFTDSGNSVVRRIDAFSGVITTVAGTIATHGANGDGGPATSATLDTPNGISFDSNGNLYIADTGNNVIRMVSTSGIITKVAGTNSIAAFAGDGGPATSAYLNAPWSVTAAPSGGFYIADQLNSRIRFVNASGIISTVAGTSAGYTGDNGPALAAELYDPASVLVDVAGNLYIADSGNNVVRRVAANTGIITTYAGNGNESSYGDGSPATAAGLYGPYAFALDTQGSLYIADVFHNRIRKVSANSAILTYPEMRVGRVSAPLTQNIENDGNSPLSISAFNPVSNSQIDPNSTTCSLTASLAVGAQCTLGVDFAPTTTGTAVNGELDADSNAGNSPAVIVLTGQVLDVDPTTAALVSSANPSATGSPVTFTITISSGGTTPTGTVTLTDGAATIATTTLGAGGVGTFPPYTFTASGTHNLTASYAGDSQNAAITATLAQVVKDQQAATTTTLTSAATPTVAGAPANLTATVNIVTANSGSGFITGTISFKQGANTLGTATINNATATSSTGTATISLTNLPVGTDSIVAVYAGNTNYLTSTSAPLVQTIQTATSTTVISSATNPSLAGAPLALTATLTSNGGIPTGSVNFMDGAVSLGSASINAKGVALLSVPGKFWTVGSHTLTAVYAGDTNNAASTSSPITEIINIAPTSTAISSSLNPAGLGASIVFTSTVTSQAGTPTGSVQFFDGSTLLGAGNLTTTTSTAAVATFTTTGLAVGAHSITAVYSGDASDSTSTSVPVTETIQTATIADTLTSSANPVIFAAPLTLTVKVAGSGSIPTGTVTLLDSGTSVASLPVPASGIVVFSNPSLAIGVHTLTAAYSGDTNHAAVTSTALTQTVQQATTTALASSSTSFIAGTSDTLTASVVGVSSKPLTGTVKFTDGSSLLSTATLDANGGATFSSASLTPGTHNIIATYSGDTVDAVSTSKTIVVTITIATTTTSFATSANPINSGSLLTLTATVAGNGGIPTGTLTFHDGATVLNAVQLSAGGTATFALSTLTPGIHQLSATYAGDTLDSPSTSATIAQKIAQVTSVTLTSATNPSLLQDNVALTIAVSNGAPSAPPTGTVILTDGGVTLATLPLGANGTVGYTFAAPTLGAHSLVASYSGDNGNSPAASQTLVQTVTLRPSAVTFTSSSTALSSGQQITLISVVQASGSRPATGTITFSSGSTVFGTATIDAAGLASLNVVPPQGTFSTIAHYSGDSLFAASDSAPTVIVVGPTIEYTIAVTPAKISMASGDHGTLNISIASATTFDDVLNLGCAGLPTDATCTFSKPTITLTGGVAQTLSVVVDTGDPLGTGSAVSSNTHPGGLSTTEAAALPAGAFLALLLFFNRRRLNKISPKLALFSLLLLLGSGATLLSGCGTSLNVNHTVAGSYTFQIIATGQKTGVTQTSNVLLTVTK